MVWGYLFDGWLGQIRGTRVVGDDMEAGMARILLQGSPMHPEETPGAAEFRGVTGAGGRRMHKQNHRNEGKLAVEQGREYGAPSLQSASREYTPPRAQLTSKTPSLI